MAQAWDDGWASIDDVSHESLPLLVIWGCCLARNNMIFDEKACTPNITGSLNVGYFSTFPHHVCVANQREVLDLENDREIPWGFFNGEERNNACGGGDIIFLSVSRFDEISMP